jgi:hypothetical protein
MLERQALLAAIDEAWRIPSPKTAMHDRQRIHSPEMTMLPAASPFSSMPGPASQEVARAADTASYDEPANRRNRARAYSC